MAVWVVAEPGTRLERDALDALCLKHMARFKQPKLYRVVKELPRNNYGKVLSSELRQRERTPRGENEANVAQAERTSRHPHPQRNCSRNLDPAERG